MKLRVNWEEHELSKLDLVEMVTTEWVYKYRGSDVTPQAELADGTPADMETMWKNILEEGLSKPLIMRVGILNKKFRLEAGNHRIQMFHK